MNLFKTTSVYSWALDSPTQMLGTVDLGLAHRYIELDPMFPFLYIPDADFKVFAKQVHKNYEKWLENNVCDDAKCKWNKPCSQVQGKDAMNLKISINKAGVGSATTTYTIQEADMFISGTEIEG